MKHLADYAARLGQCQRHYRTDQLTGPHNARHRADLLSILAGERVPASRAGINALESAAFTAFRVTDDSPDGTRACLATRRDRLRAAVIAAIPTMHETAAEPKGMPADNAAERHHHEQRSTTMQEYDAAADWCAARGITVAPGSPLPANISRDCAEMISDDTDAFQARVRECAYARSERQIAEIRSIFAANRQAIAQALPTINPTASPEQHASAAARMLADMEGGAA